MYASDRLVKRHALLNDHGKSVTSEGSLSRKMGIVAALLELLISEMCVILYSTSFQRL